MVSNTSDLLINPIGDLPVKSDFLSLFLLLCCLLFLRGLHLDSAMLSHSTETEGVGGGE